MNYKFYLFSFTACLFMLNVSAQKQNVYYLKNDGRYVNVRDSADFTRIVREPDSGSVWYNVLDYYLNGDIKLLGKSSEIEPVKLEGQAVSFYPDKKKKQIANYKNGRISGMVYDYYPNGKLYRTMEYQSKNQKVATSPSAEFISEEIVNSVYDSTGTEKVKDGKGYYQLLDEDYKTVLEEGEIIGGKRNGSWKGKANKGKVTFTEDYANGKFIKGTSVDADGNTHNYTVKEALPTFKGGERGYGNYLSYTIHYPPEARKRGIQGRVIIGFVVEKDGSLSNIRILKSVHPDLDAEAERVIKQSPKWNPGLQHGMPVQVSYVLPINFSLGR